MTRTFFSLAMVFALAATGCSKNKTDSQNPDDVAGDGDGAAGTDGDAAATSRARGSTATRSGGRNTKARKMTAKKPARAPMDTPDDSDTGPNGLHADVYALGGEQSVPKDFTALGAPTESFEVPNLNYFGEALPGLSADSDYAIQFSGSINIVEEAEYELCLHTDDGSQLFLEGTLLVDNDGVHDEPVEICELVYLAAGEYLLEVHYIQAEAGALPTVQFAWAVNGGDKEIVPSDVLFKPGTDGSTGA